MEPVLSFQELSVSYGEQKVLHHIQFDLKPSSITAIVGESGSGKSTLLRSVLGILNHRGAVTEGDILFYGESLIRLQKNKKSMREICGKRIGMIFQEAERYMDKRKTIRYQYRESIRSHRNVTKREADHMACSMLSAMNLAYPDRILDAYPFELSGGMLQRTAIAMAMSNSPQVLLADEPTSSLDVTTQAQVVSQMMRLWREYGMSILIVTHNMGLAAYMADEIVVMRNGRIREAGARDQVINSPKDDYTRQLLSAVPQL